MSLAVVVRVFPPLPSSSSTGASSPGGVMTDAPQLLLAHHLKALKLPTFLRKHDKLALQIRILTTRYQPNGSPSVILIRTPALLDFNTSSARVINGSTPSSISAFLLNSSMSTGMPLPS